MILEVQLIIHQATIRAFYYVNSFMLNQSLEAKHIEEHPPTPTPVAALSTSHTGTAEQGY